MFNVPSVTRHAFNSHMDCALCMRDSYAYTFKVTRIKLRTMFKLLSSYTK